MKKKSVSNIQSKRNSQKYLKLLSRAKIFISIVHYINKSPDIKVFDSDI